MLLFGEVRDAWRAEPRNHRAALIAIAALAVALRLAYLGQPMRYDESVTYLLFVRRSWYDALSLYTYPNNHVFHTLLAKASVTVFGNAPWAIRLPALLAGLLVVPATYAAMRALYGARAALVAAAIVASSGALTLYSTNARGYTMLVLAFLLLVLIGARVLAGAPSASRSWVVAFAMVAAAGLWTIPVMLYPLGTVSVWLALSLLLEQRRDDLRRLGVALALTVGLTLLAYWPVIAREGLGAITRNKFVASASWFEFFEQLPPTIWQALGSWALGGLATHVLMIALAICAVVALRRHSSLSLLRVGIPVAAYAFCAWLLVVNHRAPYPRVWLWLLPLAAGLAAVGGVHVADRWRRADQIAPRENPWFAAALALVLATSVLWSRAVITTPDTGTYRDAEQATGILGRMLQPDDRILLALPTNAPLAYYFDRAGLSPAAFSVDEQRARRVFVVVDAGEGQTLDAVTARSMVRDTTRFGTPMGIATLPTSRLLLYQRRDATR